MRQVRITTQNVPGVMTHIALYMIWITPSALAPGDK